MISDDLWKRRGILSEPTWGPRNAWYGYTSKVLMPRPFLPYALYCLGVRDLEFMKKVWEAFLIPDITNYQMEIIAQCVDTPQAAQVTDPCLPVDWAELVTLTTSFCVSSSGPT